MNRGVLLKKHRWIHDKAGAAGIIMLFCGFLYNFRTLINSGKWMVDSDMAAEMVLSDLLNKEGGILTRNWYYSTELHVFETQWFLRIGLLFYPDNWHRARIIGSLLILLVYSASFYFMAKKLNLRGYALLGAAIVIWPFGRDYYYYGTWGLHYLPYMIFAFFAMGLFLRYADGCSGESGKGSRAGILSCYLLGLAAAFMSGLNGIREALILYVPLLFSALVMEAMEVRRSGRENRGTGKASKVTAGRLAVRYSLCMLAGNIAGYLVNSKILAKIYHFTSFNGVSWESDFPNTYSKILGDYLQMFGYQPGTEVFSVGGGRSIIWFNAGVCSYRQRSVAVPSF